MKKYVMKVIRIKAQYGSDFQKELLEGAIDVMLKALKMHAERSHKNNEIHYRIEEQY